MESSLEWTQDIEKLTREWKGIESDFYSNGSPDEDLERV